MTQRAMHQSRGIHVAIIMDGNGRWAQRRRKPRSAGHREGARSVRSVIERCADPAAGVGTLTLYAFSSDNWDRPRDEVTGVMRLLDEYLRKETPRCVDNDVRLKVIGRRDRLSPRLIQRIEAAEAATSHCGGLLLRLAIDYSARDMMVRAAARAAAAADLGAALSRERFAELLGEAQAAEGPVPEVDLLVRTGGEQRLSDFLLWECAYAELYFTTTLWPDFGREDLDAALVDFRRRQRRFGRVLEEAV